MDAFLFQIAIVFVPGFIWASMDVRFGRKRRPSQFDFLVLTLIYGLICYAVVFVVYVLKGQDFSILDVEVGGRSSISLQTVADGIAVSIPVSIVLSVVWLLQSNRKWVVRSLQWMGITKSFGDEDVWDYSFTSGDYGMDYINFRDMEYGLTYSGWVDAFSETDRLREILLTDVIVYDSKSGELLYDTPTLYVSRHREHITIEFPAREINRQGAGTNDHARPKNLPRR
ncbi:MAG: DUF6338 family protein [Azospirillaceae bacterium]